MDYLRFKTMKKIVNYVLFTLIAFSGVSNASTLVRETPKRMKVFFVQTLEEGNLSTRKYFIGKNKPTLTGAFSIAFNPTSQHLNVQNPNSESIEREIDDWLLDLQNSPFMQISSLVDSEEERAMNDDEPEEQPKNQYFLSHGMPPKEDDTSY